MYGVVLFIKAHLLTLHYSIATPATWQFEKDGIMYGGVEEQFFSPEQIAEIESLGGQVFNNANEFLNWFNS